MNAIAKREERSADRASNLRQVLLEHGVELYNGNAKIINCMGIGTCGTCAVQVEGEVSEPNWKDKTRRSLAPHSPTANRRLACQTKVLGDVNCCAHKGTQLVTNQNFWSKHTGH